MERHLHTAATRPLVLVVEEHDDTRALYAIALSAMGFDVVPAGDAAEAYRRASELHPDIIVTELPGVNYDDWPFLQELKQNPCTREIPLVAVSGYVEPSVRERIERDGFAAFLSKPCLPDVLAARLRQVLSRHRLALTDVWQRTHDLMHPAETNQCARCQPRRTSPRLSSRQTTPFSRKTSTGSSNRAMRRQSGFLGTPRPN